uniref:Uncharacterized protein n=1 Tax=Arundo donax TaxID=35708 RepID=A0A0A9AVZ0_ARUDO
MRRADKTPMAGGIPPERLLNARLMFSSCLHSESDAGMPPSRELKLRFTCLRSRSWPSSDGMVPPR